MSLPLSELRLVHPAVHPAVHPSARTTAQPLSAAPPVSVAEVLSGALDRLLGQLPEITAASLMAHGRTGPATLAHSGTPALAADTRQCRLGTGPTLEALRLGREFVVRQPAVQPRWAGLLDGTGPTAGLAFALALPLLRRRRHGARAALTLYGGTPDDLTGLRRRARTLAEHLGDVLRLGEAAEQAHRTVTDMNRAVGTRAVIDQAVGVLMARHRCTAEEAFGLLRRTSRERSTKLRSVCQQVLDSVAPPRAGQAAGEARVSTVMSEGAPTRTGGPQAPAPRVT
ncbi:ANTAR domain-containing protein [Kitasatospora sp. NPDC096147]|uniref:ANTAR domain-containing protein n=1 Tax=Kitasatospora sp. NPDC096147 TaxID=3364093 RepID=UPI0037F9769D